MEEPPDAGDGVQSEARQRPRAQNQERVQVATPQIDDAKATATVGEAEPPEVALARTQEAVRQLEAQLRQAGELHEAAERVVRHQKRTITDLQAQLTSANQRLLAFDHDSVLQSERDRVAQLEGEIEALTSQLAVAEAQRDDAAWRLDQAAEPNTPRDDAAAEADAGEPESTEAPAGPGPLVEARAENKRLELELERLVDAEALLRAELAESMAMAEGLSAALDEASAEVDRLQTQLDEPALTPPGDGAGLTPDHEQELEDLRARCERLASARDAMTGDIEELTESSARYRGEAERLEGDLEARREDITSLTAENARLQAALDEARDAAAEGSDEVTMLRQRCEDLQTQALDAAAQCEKERAAVEARADEVAGLEDEVARLGAELTRSLVSRDSHSRLAAVEAHNQRLQRVLEGAGLEVPAAPDVGVLPPRPSAPPPRQRLAGQRNTTTRVFGAGRKPAVVAQRVSEFVDGFGERMAAIAAASEAGDADAMDRDCRALRRQSIELGLARLADLAAHVELAGAEGDFNVVPKLLAAITREFDRVSAGLESFGRGAG